MLNEIRPGRLESSGPTNKHTEKNNSRQGGRFLREGLRWGGTTAIVLASNIVPAIEAKAADQCQNLVGLTPLAGDCDPLDVNYGIILEPTSGATFDMAKRLAENGFKNLPADIQRGTSIYLVDSRFIAGDFGINLTRGYYNDMGVLVPTVDNINRGSNRIIDEPIVLGKSLYDYLSSAEATGETNIPSVYTGAWLIMANPANPVNVELLNKNYAIAFLHESIGHGFAGIDDNEGQNDVMDHYNQSLLFSLQHLQRIRNRMAVGVHRYRTPKTESKLLNAASVLSGQAIQTPDDMSVVLGVYVPVGTTQFLSLVIPYNNDGAGISDYVGTSLAMHSWGEGGRKVPAPPKWFGLLPDMTYTWIVKTTGVTEPIVDKDGKVIIDDPRWGKIQTDPGVFIYVPEAESIKQFRTPKKFADKITGDAVRSEGGGIKFRWQNPDPEVFYYEVQVSKDPTFNIDPQTATAAVYWNLIHGGITNNSWELPPELKEQGVPYYGRVRPRVQGDGTPVVWSQPWEFDPDQTIKTAEPAAGIVDQRYSFLKDNPTPDFVLSGEGYQTHVYSPQKVRYSLVTNNPYGSSQDQIRPLNRAERRKQARISRAGRMQPAA